MPAPTCARSVADCGRPRRPARGRATPRASSTSWCAFRARGRPAPGDRTPDDDAAGPAAAQARAHQPPDRRHGGRDGVLHRRARAWSWPTGSATPARGSTATPEHHQMALVDAGYAHFHHIAFDYYDFGTLRGAVRQPRAARPLARRGGRCATASRQNICGYVRITEEPLHRRVLRRHGAARGRARAARTGPTTASRPTPGGPCRPARTSASTPLPSSPNARAARPAASRSHPCRRPDPWRRPSPPPAPAPASSSWTGSRGDAREIWMNGERISHPLEHPALEAAARSIARVFDLQHEHADEMLYPSREDRPARQRLAHHPASRWRTCSAAGARSS